MILLDPLVLWWKGGAQWETEKYIYDSAMEILRTRTKHTAFVGAHRGHSIPRAKLRYYPRVYPRALALACPGHLYA